MELPLVIFGMLNEITTGKFMNDMLNIPNESSTFRYRTTGFSCEDSDIKLVSKGKIFWMTLMIQLFVSSLCDQVH